MLILQQSLGIDLREDTLRLVLLGKTFKGVTLIDHLIKTYPNLKDKTQEGEAFDELLADLKSFLEGHTRPTDIILGIPRQKVILRELRLPILGREQLKEILSYEIEKHIPLPSQEVYYDYKPMGKISESEQKIMLGIVRKEDLDFYLLLFERAELAPTLATPLCFALKDCPGCNHLPDSGLGLMLDLSDKELELDLLQGDRLINSRTVAIKEGSLDDDFIICQTEKPEDKATAEGIDTYTRSIGSGVICILRHWLRTVRSSIDGGLSRIVLTGISTYDYLLSDYLHDQYGIDVYIPNPFQGLTEKKIPGRKASAFAIATGLAIKGLKEKYTDLNFLPPEMQVRRSSHALAFTVVFLSLLFLIITTTAYTGFGKYNWFYLPKRFKLERIVNTSSQLQDQVYQVKELSKKIDEISKEVEEVHNLMEGRVSKLEILKEMSSIVPEDAWLDKADVTNEKVEISGYADTSSILIGILEDSPLLENVIFPSTITKRGREKERFRIKADIQKGLKE